MVAVFVMPLACPQASLQAGSEASLKAGPEACLKASLKTVSKADPDEISDSTFSYLAFMLVVVATSLDRTLSIKSCPSFYQSTVVVSIRSGGPHLLGSPIDQLIQEIPLSLVRTHALSALGGPSKINCLYSRVTRMCFVVVKRTRSALKETESPLCYVDKTHSVYANYSAVMQICYYVNIIA